AAGLVLHADRRRPQASRPAVWAQRHVAVRAIGLEPVGTLPARLLPKRRAQVLQPGVQRGDAQRPAGRALVAGVLDVVVGRVDLVRPGKGVVAAEVGAAEAPGVHLPDVEAGLALGDPLSHEPAHPARASQPVGAEAGGDPRSEEHTSELQSRFDLVCRLLLEKKKKKNKQKNKNNYIQNTY